MTRPSIGVGLIGLGVMGRRMLDSMGHHSRFRPVSGFDRRAVHGLPIEIAPSAEAVIYDPQVQCVYIATPPASHEALIATAAGAGKAIFCEKPLAASGASARRCELLANGCRVRAALNYPFATAANARRLAELVHDGRFGALEAASLNLRFAHWPRPWQREAGAWLANRKQGGFMREVASHFVFLANRLFGEGKIIAARVERGRAGTEVFARATIEYRHVAFAIQGSVGGSVLDHNRLDVIGSCGRASITDWYRLESTEGGIEPQRPDEGQLDALALLVDGTDSPLATFAEGVAVVDLIESILASG